MIKVSRCYETADDLLVCGVPKPAPAGRPDETSYDNEARIIWGV